MSHRNLIIGDADALIALNFEEDSLHKRAVAVSQKLEESDVRIIFPDTAIAETITTLLRKYSNPGLSGFIADQYRKGVFHVQYIDEEIMQEAAELFNPHGSKQNTFFDAIVLATAKVLKSDAIFSFDKWYKKQGFMMAEELLRD